MVFLRPPEDIWSFFNYFNPDQVRKFENALYFTANDIFSSEATL